MNIIVNFAARTVNVDNLQYACLTEVPKDQLFVRWYGNSGQIEMSTGDLKSVGFDAVQPYYDQWWVAKNADDEKLASAKAAEAAPAKEQQDHGAERKQKREDAADLQRKQEPLIAALTGLASTDHEVIKAMEAKLAADKALPDEFVARRQELREVVKAEREKFK